MEQERYAEGDHVLELCCDLHLDLVAHLFLIVHRLREQHDVPEEVLELE